MMSRVVLAVLLCFCVGIQPGRAAADVASVSKFDIPPQQLPSALLEFSRQSGVTVTSAGDILEGKSSPGVVGAFDARGALDRILKDTRLSYDVVDRNTVLITSPQEPSAPASSAPTADADAKPSSAPGQLEEIVVTAQKRAERLQDVPVPVSVLNAGKLVTGGQFTLQDYYTRIPGLSLTPPGSYGGSTIAIRGLVSGLYSNPTVGTVIDDVSYNSPSSSGFGNVVAEVDPSDLAQVEVLRGPQGTLYGASSLGGLLKYVTVDPDPDALTGNAQIGLSQFENGDDAGYSVRGNVNVPLSDSWAMRVSGFTREDPGYIDDPDHGLKGVNEQRVSGGRVSALWRPSENLSLKFSALLQDADSSGNNYVSANSGDALEQSVVPNSGGYEKKLQIYSASLSARAGKAEITSISAYADVDTTFLFDLSPGLGGIAQSGIPGTGFNGFGVSGVSVIQPSKTTRFTQEVRVAMPLGERIEWLMGAYYADEDTDGSQRAYAADFNTSAIAGELARFRTIASFEEYAAFTNFTFDISDRFDVQVGGRVNKNEATYAQTASLAWVNGGVAGGGTQFDSDDSAFTYLLTPRFRLSPSFMMYARLASGYRPGGPNTSIGLGIPSDYGSDETQNYELGVKGALLEGLLDFDASLYYIDWKDIQIALVDPATFAGYNSNGSRARSQGVELSVESRPVPSLILSAWATYSDAELTEDLPPTASNAFALSGDRLPYSSRFSGSVSLDKEFPLGTWTGSIGASVSYVGNRKESFAPNSTTLRQELPSYTKTDLRASAKHDTWTLDLFVNNLADKRGLIGAGSTAPGTVTYIPPRSVGLLLSKTF